MRCVATDALVIGYGNDLRADDGAGRYVADAIEARRLPGVTVRSVPQLTPELALEVAGVDVVVFVDASVDDDALAIRRIEAGPTGHETMTHHGDPSSLLSMVASVGEQPRRAYIVSIPATNLRLGFDLTPRTEVAVAHAIEEITELVARVGRADFDVALRKA